MAVDGAEQGRVLERLFDLLLLLQQIPQRLFHVGYLEERLGNFLVPMRGKVFQIIRADLLPAFWMAAEAAEVLAQIQRAVIVGQLFAHLDVTGGDLEIVTGGHAVRGTGVVEEPGVVPAQDDVTPRVHERVLLEDLLVNGLHGGGALWSEDLIKVVTHPHDGAFGDEVSREDAVSYFFANEL